MQPQRSAPAAPSFAEPLAIDALGRLAADVPCVSCGHNLRGLHPLGVCGECGVPARPSIYGQRLLPGTAEWVAATRRSACALVWCYFWIWFPPACLLACYFAWDFVRLNPARKSTLSAWNMAILRFALILVATVAVLAGATLIIGISPTEALGFPVQAGPLIAVMIPMFLLWLAWAGIVVAGRLRARVPRGWAWAHGINWLGIICALLAAAAFEASGATLLAFIAVAVLIVGVICVPVLSLGMLLSCVHVLSAADAILLGRGGISRWAPWERPAPAGDTPRAGESTASPA